MKNLNLLYTTFLIVFCSYFAISQGAPEKTFTEKLNGISTSSKELTKSASTDNSSVGQSGEMSTSVPLVTISSKTMQFPLQLNYTSGIRVDQQSGSVGLGWVMPIGSITRDYGAFQPDYSSTLHEGDMWNAEYKEYLANGGDPNQWIDPKHGWLNSTGDAINPTTHNCALDYDIVPVGERQINSSDFYRVNVPNLGNNSFFNAGQIGGPHNWMLTEKENWKIIDTVKTYEIDQEYSRINEINIGVPYIGDKNNFDLNGSIAAAIGVLPYVKNGYAVLPSTSVLEKVRYEDFKEFIIVDPNGTQYVFGRALRGQKYLFQEDPFWSASSDINYYNPNTSSTANAGAGNFWKIDYIAEWLLTEIRSVDYFDTNHNFIADDEDQGDWIRFEYTEAEQEVTTVPLGSGNFFYSMVPKHREWSSFSQTDQASSLMRERAYLTHIVTPSQKLDFTISQRYDVEHDYYAKPANKLNQNTDYYYENRKMASTTGHITDFDISYPIETMKYDKIDVYSRLINGMNYPSENLLTGSIAFNYAAKGSTQELAVSEYLIRNNDNTPKLQGGTHLGAPSNPADFNIENYKDNVNKRGKTTLLSLDFYGGDMNVAEKTSYKFEYGYNPSYNEVHKREITRKWTSPSLRQSGYGKNPKSYVLIPNYIEQLLGSNGIPNGTSSHSSIKPDEFLIDIPFSEVYYKLNFATQSEVQTYANNQNNTALNYSINPTPILHVLQPIKDVYGFLYANNCTECPKAWSLTKIIYPTGGEVSFEYELGSFAKSTDEPNWSFKGNEVPIVKEYNQFAKQRSYVQDAYNRAFPMGIGPQQKLKTLTATFEVDMPVNYGIRLKSKTINDKINPTVTTSYEYGTGHFTTAPSEYVQAVVGNFNQFMRRERERHSWEQSYYGLGNSIIVTTDFDEYMRYLAVTGMALDDYQAIHFYESRTEKLSDNSKIKHHFAPLDNSATVNYDAYNLLCYNLGETAFDGGFILVRNNMDLAPIMELKTEFFASGATTPYKSITNTYSRTKLNAYKLKVEYSGGLNYDDISTNDVPNTVKLWDNTFDFYMSTLEPNSTNYFIGTLQNPHLSSSLYLPYNNIPTYEYERWAQYKTTLTSTITNYKGMESAKSYIYNGAFLLQQENASGANTPEQYITEYEYAYETYGAQTSLFFDKNIFNAPTKVTSYLQTVNPNKVLKAEMTTYDYSSYPSPKMKDKYAYETSILNADGTFVLVPYDILTSNPNWRRDQHDNIEYNKHGAPILAKSNQLFNKTVMGNNLNLPKATFSFPEYKFDATYTGFEDLLGSQIIPTWQPLDYKDEKWFKVTNAPDLVAYSINLSANPCNLTDLSSPPNANWSKYLNVITVNDVSNLSVGDQVEVELFGNEHTSPTSYSYWTDEVTISAIIQSSTVPNPPANAAQYMQSYVLCFTTPLEYPNSDQFFGQFMLGDAKTTIALTTVTKKVLDQFSLNKSYKHTGKYSCQLRSKRTANQVVCQTPIRPVKTYSSFTTDCALVDPENPEEFSARGAGTENLPDHCFYNYEASVWLLYDTDIAPQGGVTIQPKTLDSAGDAIYRRGTVTDLDNHGNIKIICDIYNQNHTILVDQYVFYPENLDGGWQQFTVNFEVLKNGQKWVDVYVVNNKNQIGQPVSSYKSLFVDDLLIYPTGAKYQYETYDKFGSPTFSVNNNDVFVESIYDQKGRPVSQKNAYASVMNQISYFENPNWTTQNNYITQTNWVDNGKFNTTRAYLDGFGKTKQIVVSDPSRSARIVTETNAYNTKGQVIKSYKPYVLGGANLGSMHHATYQNKTQELYGSNFAFTEAKYESKPEALLAAMVSPKTNSEADIINSQIDYINTSTLQNVALGYNYTAGQLVVHELTNALGYTTKTYIDNLGRVIMEEHPIGKSHIQNVNGSISENTSSTAQVAQTWFKYDGAGRITDVYDPENKHTKYTYNSLGLVIESNSPDKGRSKMRYDKYGQIRMVQNEKDILASEATGKVQFKYLKYDTWGRIIESGIQLTNAGCTSCSSTDFFNDYSSIDNQDFPLATSKLVQVHLRNEYDGARDQFNSNQLLKETAYSMHQLQANFTYTNAKKDAKSYAYMADGQLAEVSYEFDGLLDPHKITPVYNGLRSAVGKNYKHPTNGEYNFSWSQEIDNFGKIKKNFTTHNSQQTLTSQYYYDVMGNLLMKGLGATGTSANPHFDYMSYHMDIRNQVTMNQSKTLRIGLSYDAIGNITSQRWSNEHFDPTTSGPIAINQYDYYYDKMNRLTGADYKTGTFSQNPFSNFTNLVTHIPNDFLCGINESMLDAYIDPILRGIEDDATKGKKFAKDALNLMNFFKAYYISYQVPFGSMDQAAEDLFFTRFINDAGRKSLVPSSFEYYKATLLNDTIHIDSLNQNQFDKRLLKYTRLVAHGLPFDMYVDCVPNTGATVYGFLPTFPNPTSVSNVNKYDAAYWYEKNGNTTQLNRNDDLGNKMIQEYSYYNGANNRLDEVVFVDPLNIPGAQTVNYQYDATGNLLTDPKNNVTAIDYISYNDMPQSITNTGGTKNYRYDGKGTRVVKQNTSTDINFYLDGVVLNANGKVLSYQTADGYAIPYDNAGIIAVDYFYYLSDWLGTVRGVLDANGATLNANDHYPFGMRLPGRAFTSSTAEGERYQFTGHEYDGETNYEYHGARYYNRELGRYMTTDRFAQKFHNQSPYVYAGNMPTTAIDANGDSIVKVYNVWYDEDGNRHRSEGKSYVNNDLGDVDVNRTNIYNSYDDYKKGNISKVDFKDKGGKNLISYNNVGEINSKEYAGRAIMNDAMKKNGMDFSFNSFSNFPSNSNSGSKMDGVNDVATGVGIAGTAVSQIEGTFRLAKSGKISPGYYSSGWNTGNQYVKNLYSFSKIGNAVSNGANIVTTGVAYYKVSEGSADPITYTDAAVGTAGLMTASASYFYGVEIPVVGEFVAFYGICRVTWDVFYNLGAESGPSKWYGNNDSKWFE